ncbi:MAG: DUF3105 domain-containing protein [Anaerolineae bacterium]
MARKQSAVPNFKRSRATVGSSQTKIPGWVWLAGGIVLAVLAVIGLFYLGNQTAGAVQGDIDGVLIFPDPGRGHRDGELPYTTDVPVGGLHNPEWQNCGIYDQPVRTENAIHSLEHGAVWIAYQPDLPADQVETLRALVREDQAGSQERWVLLAPKPDLKDPIVATAWRVQLRLDNASDPRLAQFMRQYQKGPYYPEPGANCTFGGIGQPLS